MIPFAGKTLFLKLLGSRFPNNLSSVAVVEPYTYLSDMKSVANNAISEKLHFFAAALTVLYIFRKIERLYCAGKLTLYASIVISVEFVFPK